MVRSRVAFVATFLLSLCFDGFVLALEPKPFVQSGQRIVFLGDSNTFRGEYIALLETWLRQHHPEGQWTLINLGLPSETASGLSEPAHSYPRPCIHTRLEAALEKSKPDVAVLCYGTNDGIYYPFSEERFTAYREGITKLITACRRAKAKIVLMTPPPFDPEPMRKSGQLKPAGEKEYAWSSPYEGYDQVMAKYTQWVLSQSDAADIVVDIRTPMLASEKPKGREGSVPTMLPDSIHYNLEGHRIVALKLWAAWGLAPTNPADGQSEQLFSIVSRRQQILRDAWLTHVGHKRPGMTAGLPLDEAETMADEILKASGVR